MKFTWVFSVLFFSLILGMHAVADHTDPGGVIIDPDGPIILPVEELVLHCSSSRYRYAECYLPGPIIAVQMIRRVSIAQCREGQSYGVTRGNVLWVHRGCRADFRVFYQSPFDVLIPEPNDFDE